MARESTTPIAAAPAPDTFSLFMPVPQGIRALLHGLDVAEEDLLIATNTDLDIIGEYAESWLIATREKVLVFMFNEDASGQEHVLIAKEVPVSEIAKVRTDTRVGSGFLEVRRNGVYEEVIRYSNRNAEKFAKAAAQLRFLAEGREVAIPDGSKAREYAASKAFKDAPHIRVRRGTVFFRFLGYTRGYWPLTLLAMILVMITILLLMFPQQLVQVLIDQVFEQKPSAPAWFTMIRDLLGITERLQLLYLLVGLLAASTLAISIVSVFRETLAAWINNRLGYDLRREVFGRIEELALRYHEAMPVGQLMTRCAQDIEILQAFINQLTSGFGFQLLLVIGVAGIMFSMDWQLALVACVPAPLVMLCTLVFTRKVTPIWRRYWARRSDLNSGLHSILSGIRVVKAYAQEGREAIRFDRISGQFRDVGLSVGYANSWFYPLMGFVFQLGGYFIWISGGSAIIEDPANTRLTLGELIAFLGYLGMFYAPLNSLTQMSTWFTQFTTQAHRVFEVLDQDSEMHECKECVHIGIQGAIEFHNVTFGYDPHLPVLKEISFKVEPGEMIGIVGHSGCGKSTTVNLMMRFYDPSEGEITIDNIDVRKIKKRSLRRQIGLVPQDPFLFRGTIADNIAYGNPEVAPEQVLDAALQANAHMFITRNHDGYDARLGERGAGLSGGERQRVAIAQALLHNPRVLILDEATSSVDTISEREIQRALEALSRGRTTIAIAHRLSTLRHCDRILVFEEGEIREHGSHEKLMALNGIYRKLVQTQTELDGASHGSVDNMLALKQLEAAVDSQPAAPRQERNAEVPRIYYPSPELLEITTAPQGGMNVTYEGKEYRNVRAYRCFPISRPHEFIALWIGETALEHKEIAMIRRLKDVSADARRAIELELLKRYFIHYVERIWSVEPNRNNMAFLDWEAETDKGRVMFITRRWERHAVVEGGKNGRIIFDLDENRYEIADMDALDPESQRLFFAYIYW